MFEWGFKVVHVEIGGLECSVVEKACAKIQQLVGLEQSSVEEWE